MRRHLVQRMLVAPRSSLDCRAAKPLLAALAVHAALALMVRVVVPTGPLSTRHKALAPPPEGLIDVALDVGGVPNGAPNAATATPEPPVAVALVAPRRIEAAARPGLSESEAVPGIATIGNGSTGPERGPEVAAAAGWFRPNAVVDLSLSAGAAGDAPHSLPDAPAQAPPASTTGGLAESLDAEDLARGLGRGGPVRTAVEDAARSGDAPTFGIATFAVVIGSDGKVSVDLAAASGERSAWEGLRPAIRTALLGKAIRIAPKSRGLRVAVRVEASEQFPGGGRPPAPNKVGTKLSGSVGKVTETKDHIEIELPSVALTYQSRNCSAGIGISAGGLSAGGGCSSGVAMRVVSARIVSEERL